MDVKCVSVVIPSYNRAHLLEQTIPSYIQEYVGEVIVVDDCSKDNTVDVVKQLQEKYPLIKYIRMKQNSKQTAAKNRGVRDAKYPYIYLGDDDSFIVDGTIKHLLYTMKKYNADIVGAKALYMNSIEELQNIEEFIRENSRSVSSVKDALDIYKLFYINFDFDLAKAEEVPFVAACALVKRNVFEKVQFDTNYKGNAFREETDFFTVASASGKSIYYDSTAVQINLPRNLMVERKAFLKFKLRSSFYEFVNTYKYLRKNIGFIQKYYGISDGYGSIWLRYMKDAVLVKIFKFAKLLRGSR